MKKAIFLVFALIGISIVCFAQKPKNKKVNDKIAEIACGECMFKMPGKGCDLAVRIDGKPYFVDGRAIDDFGDAHADDGFCNFIKKGKVSGEIVKSRFKAKSIQLEDKQ